MKYSSSSLLVSTPNSGQNTNNIQNPYMNSPQVLSKQMTNSSHGPVAILWDIENCPVPSGVRPEDVTGNIRMALRVHPIIEGGITVFSAYGDFNAFPRRLREGCQRTGVKLVDVPNGRKDAADKAILIDMFLFALDSPPPSSIMLISGDIDFAPALHVLGQRGYNVILVIPSGVGVSSALSNAGRFVWDWPSVARGEGFVPPAKPSNSPSGISANIIQIEEEAIVHRGVSQRCNSTQDFAMISKSLSECNSTSISIPSSSLRSQSLLPETRASCDHNNLIWARPGDLNGLKRQLVQLLELFGGSIPLTRFHGEYQKLYSKPLYISEYGAGKLVNLLKKMSDAIGVEGKGYKRLVYLLQSRTESNRSPIILAKRERKGKESREEIFDRIIKGVGSSDELSDDERVVVREQGRGKEKSAMELYQNLENFKCELQEILVSYCCRISLSCFEEIYQQRYKKSLEYERFGVNDLAELLDMMKDVVVLQEEPVTKRKCLVAIGW